ELLSVKGDAEQVGRGLQELDLVVRELAWAELVDLEHAVRPVLALNDDVHAADDAYSEELRPRGEPVLSGEITHDYRLVNPQCVVRLGVTVRRDLQLAHDAGRPADTSTHEE